MMRLLLLSLTAIAFGPAVAGPQGAPAPVAPSTDARPMLVIGPDTAEPVLRLTDAGAVPVIDPDTGQLVKCRIADAHLAGRDGPAPVEPLQPHKLNELPPATGFMAVYRHIGGCNAPLTMTEYRNPRRR